MKIDRASDKFHEYNAARESLRREYQVRHAQRIIRFVESATEDCCPVLVSTNRDAAAKIRADYYNALRLTRAYYLYE